MTKEMRSLSQVGELGPRCRTEARSYDHARPEHACALLECCPLPDLPLANIWCVKHKMETEHVPSRWSRATVVDGWPHHPSCCWLGVSPFTQVCGLPASKEQGNQATMYLVELATNRNGR